MFQLELDLLKRTFSGDFDLWERHKHEAPFMTLLFPALFPPAPDIPKAPKALKGQRANLAKMAKEGKVANGPTLQAKTALAASTHAANPQAHHETSNRVNAVHSGGRVSVRGEAKYRGIGLRDLLASAKDVPDDLYRLALTDAQGSSMWNPKRWTPDTTSWGPISKNNADAHPVHHWLVTLQ